MRHVVEVMIMIEGKAEWAKQLQEIRKQHGLPLPIVEFNMGSGGDDNSSGVLPGPIVKRVRFADTVSVCGLWKKLVGLSGGLGKLVVSFI